MPAAPLGGLPELRASDRTYTYVFPRSGATKNLRHHVLRILCALVLRNYLKKANAMFPPTRPQGLGS